MVMEYADHDLKAGGGGGAAVLGAGGLEGGGGWGDGILGEPGSSPPSPSSPITPTATTATAAPAPPAPAPAPAAVMDERMTQAFSVAEVKTLMLQLLRCAVRYNAVHCDQGRRRDVGFGFDENSAVFSRPNLSRRLERPLAAPLRCGSGMCNSAAPRPAPHVAPRTAPLYCSGMAYMHDHWVLHRDLKTSNILYTNRCGVCAGCAMRSDGVLQWLVLSCVHHPLYLSTTAAQPAESCRGELKLCDFGLARQVSSSAWSPVRRRGVSPASCRRLPPPTACCSRHRVPQPAPTLATPLT